MQTPQVSSPTSPLPTPAAANKQADGKSTESFGQVLSREVSERNNTEQPKSGEGTGTQAAPANAQAAAESKTSEDGDSTKETSGADGQTPADILALVASLNQLAVDPSAKPATQDPALTGIAADATNEADTGKAIDGLGQRKTIALPAEQDGKALPGLDAATSRTAAPATEAAPGRALRPDMQAAAPDFSAALKESAVSPNAMMTAVQHVAPQVAHTMTAQHAEKLTPPVGTPAWDQALGQKVVWMVAGDQQSASLTLNPPDLGPLQVVINVSNSQANATFTAAQPEVRQALEAALPKLRDMLGEAGIQLGQASVNSGSPNQQSAPDQQASRARHGGRDAGDSHGDAPVRVGRVQPAVSGRGLVDTFV